MLNLLFIADVIGGPGRDVVRALLPDLRRRYGVGLVICNGENAAGGFGLTRDSAESLFDAGVDVLTGGNHLWDRKESLSYLGEEKRLVRPANLPPGTPGRGWAVFRAVDGTRVGILNLLGRVFMKEADCPFRTADLALESLRQQCRVVVVDLHAETTAEKIAMGWHLDSRVCAVIGTHTHVQTADEAVLPGGTAFLSDAGMTGGFDSVIGMDRQVALRRFLTLMPERFVPATGDLRMNAVLLRIDAASGRAVSIQRLQIPCAARPAAGAAKRLGGEEPAAAVRAAAGARVRELRTVGVVPTLALVSVGEDPASKIYLRRKTEACAEVGIEVRRAALPAGAETAAVVERVRALAEDPGVHGVLVQLPLAPPAEAGAVLEAVPPEKDVDGFHPVNAGRLAAGLPGFVPATPRGILELLRYHHVPLAGRHAVVLGRSNIVGRPLASLLSMRGVDMTVTIGHSASGRSLPELARQADLLVAAIGQPEAVTAEWVKPGAVVVDVGVHRVGSAERKGRLTGDVEVASVSRVASAFTPVPGGVGPMTVAMLVANTVLAVDRQREGTQAPVRG
ncbi:MAG TPA: TIGR00282 family metallophosphoesterase [Candidatus Eisenbacteria bacterium]